jgi:hypothetical protein
MPSEGEHVAIQTNDETLIPKVIEFIRSASYQEKEEIIRRHSALLDEEADRILAQIEAIWAGRGDKQTAQSISNWRDFLSRVAKTDFEMAVLEDKVMAAFVGLPRDHAGDYISRLTALYPELLNERADEAFRNVKARFSDDKAEVLAVIFDAMQKAVEKQRAEKNPSSRNLKKPATIRRARRGQRRSSSGRGSGLQRTLDFEIGDIVVDVGTNLIRYAVMDALGDGIREEHLAAGLPKIGFSRVPLQEDQLRAD